MLGALGATIGVGALVMGGGDGGPATCSGEQMRPTDTCIEIVGNSSRTLSYQEKADEQGRVDHELRIAGWVCIGIGGLVVLVSLTRGSWPAIAVAAGVFVGAEIAALGRRFGVDHDAPAGPEVRITATTIAVGLGTAALVALVAIIRASAPIANIALALGLVLGVVILAVNHLRDT